MVYDTGRGGQTFEDGVSSIVPAGEDIDLLILRHTDSDHIGGADELLEEFRIKTIVRPGLRRGTDAWKAADAAITAEAAGGAEVRNLADSPLTVGEEIQFRETRVIFVSGFSQPTDSWETRGDSEINSAGSIVVRLVFAHRSILFTGDAVGLELCDPDSCATPAKLFATELYMGRERPSGSD